MPEPDNAQIRATSHICSNGHFSPWLLKTKQPNKKTLYDGQEHGIVMLILSDDVYWRHMPSSYEPRLKISTYKDKLN